jgi:hypothetical protein
MNYSTDLNDDDITLIDTIRNISGHICLYGSKQDTAHSEFLLEVVEDMREQVESIRYYHTISSQG